MSNIVIPGGSQGAVVKTGGSDPVQIVTRITPISVGAGGMPGPAGPPGPPGPSGTMVVAVPYDQWPPADPQSNTLYLRLAP